MRKTGREGERKRERENFEQIRFRRRSTVGLTAFRRRVNPFISVAPFYIRVRQFPPRFPRGSFLFFPLFRILPLFCPFHPFFSRYSLFLFEIFDFRLSFCVARPIYFVGSLDPERSCERAESISWYETIGNNWFFLFFPLSFYDSFTKSRILNFNDNFFQVAIKCKEFKRTPSIINNRTT